MMDNRRAFWQVDVIIYIDWSIPVKSAPSR